ncbi:hypothetical protein CS0771_54220 [Catellatospora sp. IY07-71]|uniref:transposase n=1 Tax=Catellatospora sp. IY07-71 TaxID=2728827 RepID=UPI001BB52B08|nr:transposase [Catellatospora sp. IY07-71]BCJ75878.1 hypothetical protein CS0771_54220 [Catellatospora sp. IY07-71]
MAEIEGELKGLPKRIGEPILAAWHAKEDLLDLLATARTHPNRKDIADLLCRFYRRCAESGLPELEGLATTVQTWWPEILAFIRTGITKAGSEGTNRDQDRRPGRVRLPQPGQPAATRPLCHDPARPRTSCPSLTSLTRDVAIRLRAS